MQTLSKPAVPLGLVALMLVASLTPLAMADGGRSTPDFVVSSFTLDDAGSMNLGGGIEAEDATHVVRVQVQNIGLAAGQASLTLLLQGTASSGDVVIDSTDLGVIAAGASSAVSVFSWSATLGANQILKARISSSTDVNTANNEDQMVINVSRYQNSSVPVVDIPQPSSGASSVVWSQTMHDFTVKVRNDGVKNQSAQFYLNFTEAGNPTNAFSEVSSIVPVVRPGSLYAGGASLYDVTMQFDATARTGQWDVVGEMHFNGLNWANSIEFLNQRVVFSNYDFELTAAHDRSVEPGQTAQLTYAIENTGVSVDDYQVSVSDVNGWVSAVSPSPSTPTVTANGTTYVFVDVAVPASALRTDADTITLSVTSNGGGFAKSVSTTILASESYDGTVEMDSDTKSLTPGNPSPIQVKVQNDGNAPTSFTLNAGISTNPINWDLSFSSATTGTLQPGESVNVTLTVTPPVIQNPLVAAEYNGAGDTMSVWAQATSVNGGVPEVNATPVRILPVIVVDPGLPTESIDMTVQQVLEAQQGSGLEEILDLEVEVRHNLVTELSETVDTTLSLGTPVFTSDSSGGFSEAARWAVGLTPTSLPGMSLGEARQAVLTVQGPADDYSVAGSLSIPITATPSLGAAHSSANVIPTSISQTLTINIPPVLGVEGHNGTTLDAMVGEETTFDIDLANTGNNMTSYRLVLNDQVPDGWDVSFSTSSIMPSTTVTDVPADVADYPSNASTHITTFPLILTTDPEAPANSVEPIGIDVFEMSSGTYIASFEVPIRVGEKVNASLSPTSQTVNLSIGETITTSVIISNDGNTPATFGVYLDTSNAGEIDFVLETPTVVQIGAGYESTVRVRLTPTTDALAAANYYATVWVSNVESGLNLSANILGNISEQHGLVVGTLEEIGVVPGETQTVDFSLINNGNLVEDVIVETSVAGNWTVTPASLPLSLDVGATYTGSFDVDVPALTDDNSMANGALYPVTIRVLNASTGDELKVHTFRFVVAPLFLVEVEDWPTTMDYHRGISRTWDVKITNTGNKDVEVNVTYTLLQGGLTTPSLDWEVSPTAPSRVFLPRGETVPFSFSISSVAVQPALTLAANLILTLDPTEAAVQGSAEYYTDLRMNRFFEFGDTSVTPPSDNGPQSFSIVYSHIPMGPESAVAYELELCRAERLLDVDDLGQNASLYGWTFAVRVDDTDYPLNMSAFCGSTSLGPESRITLPSRQPWVTSAPIELIVDAPNPPNILPGDGWDLTFRLYHPDENSGYTIYEEDVFTYQLAVFADPAIHAQGPVDPEAFYEGQETQYQVTVRNDGTAQALGVSAMLDCNGAVDVLSVPDMVPIMAANAEHTFTWDVRPVTIDWWEVERTVQCDATLSFLYVGDGNDETNDRSQGVELGEETVQSWSPDLSIAFVACVVAALLSFVFVRLSSQSEKWQLGGVYAGVIAFGFAFHLFQVPYYGPAILALSALWIWRMTWKSSDEFRLIHEDYQRARKGTSTVYSDHFEALKDSRRQLTIILSIPVLGMLAIVLGLPPQLSTDSDNLVAMAAYFFIIMAGVWYLLKRSDKMYGNLYGRMTDAEIKSIRIERDLSDPARLLNDLADDGLDFSAILGERAPVAAAATASPGTPAGVASEPIIPHEYEKEPATDLAFEAEEMIEEEVGDDV
ncbi:MAG: NEW3 domain-containing protein [Poseidonia sp.]